MSTIISTSVVPPAVAALAGAVLLSSVGVVLASPTPARRAQLSAAPIDAPAPHLPPLPDRAALHPGVPADRTGLAAELERRYDLARDAAAEARVRLRVNSGWRTLEQQKRLQRRAVAQYGSPAEAARWVLPPHRSEHPRGRALDIGPPSSARWLGKHGWRFGLCRRYANEPWHFEPLTWPGEPCPPVLPSAAH